MDIQMNELRIVESELGISVEVLVEAIEDALMHAYQRVPGAIRGARVEMDRGTGKVTVWAPEVDEEGTKIDEFDDTPGDFGRIATATAKSIIAQRLRDAEADRILGSFKGKQGQVVSGVVQQNAGRNGESRDLLVDVGEHEAILRGEEQVPTGLKKFGAMLGDFVEVGCNSVLNPGTVVGRHTNIYPTSCVRGVIPPDSIYKDKVEIVLKK